MTNINKLEERLDALDHSQPGRKRPTLMGEVEGEAWIYYCISLLSDDERREHEQVMTQINKNEETRPDSNKSPEWDKYREEDTQLCHRLNELLKIGEIRAEAAPWEPWIRFEAEYRDAKAQLAKVRSIENGEVSK